jgi:hypothetical protein
MVDKLLRTPIGRPTIYRLFTYRDAGGQEPPIPIAFTRGPNAGHFLGAELLLSAVGRLHTLLVLAHLDLPRLDPFFGQIDPITPQTTARAIVGVLVGIGVALAAKVPARDHDRIAKPTERTGEFVLAGVGAFIRGPASAFVAGKVPAIGGAGAAVFGFGNRAVFVKDTHGIYVLPSSAAGAAVKMLRLACNPTGACVRSLHTCSHTRPNKRASTRSRHESRQHEMI